VRRALGLGGQAAAAALQVGRAHHLLHHAHRQTLVEAAVLAAVAAPLVHRAVLVGQAHVLGVLLDGALEEALAALARPHAVVLAGGVVAADGAQLAGRHGIIEVGGRGRRVAVAVAVAEAVAVAGVGEWRWGGGVRMALGARAARGFVVFA